MCALLYWKRKGGNVMQRITVDQTKFKNELGGEVILYGINYVDKGWHRHKGKRKEYIHVPDEKLLLRFKAAGFNCVRLGLIWDAIEPQPSQYNEEYLDRMVEVGRLCEKLGIYFYLDMHQDLYGSTFSDGAPEWACLTNGCAYEKPSFVWAEGYFFGKATHNAFHAFWHNQMVNGKGLQEYYADMWQHVAQRFCDNTALVGYDLMNEPFPCRIRRDVFTAILEAAVQKTEELSGLPADQPMHLRDCFANTTEKKGFRKLVFQMVRRLKNPKKVKALRQVLMDKELFHEVVCSVEDEIKAFDTCYYTPFLNRVAQKLRAVDSDHIIFMENSYWSNLGIPYSAEKPQVDGRTDAHVAFAPHGYDLFVDTPLYQYASDDRVLRIFEEHQRSQERLGVPVLVGEWGAFPDKPIAVRCAQTLLDFFDENQWSSTYWCYYRHFLSTKVMQALKRPHPQVVYGKILQYRYQSDRKLFTLCFEQSPAHTQEPSVVYLPSAPRSVQTDCRTELVKNPDGEDCLLHIFSEGGSHLVKVQL